MKHHRTWLFYLLCFALAIRIALFSPGAIAFFPSPTSPTPASTEVRGVWITNVTSGVLFVPWGIDRALSQLAKLNFNTVYPVVWNRGRTFYPSFALHQKIGRSQDTLLSVMHLNQDVLAKIITESHRRGLRVIPWFEYGFLAPANSLLAKRHPDWITTSFIPTREKLVSLNPLHPEVQQFILDLVLEVVTRYDVDGIQFDDHFSFPVDTGYDPVTIALYQKEHGGRQPPNDFLSPEWMRWRADKLTAFLAKVVKEVKAVKPNCIISVSPNGKRHAYRFYLQDWPTWVNEGLVDELVLQVYRDNTKSFLEELNKPAVKVARQKIPVSIGVLSGLRTRPVPIDHIEEQVKIVRDRQFNGVSFFYWESLWSYMTPDAPQERRKVFQSLFSP